MGSSGPESRDIPRERTRWRWTIPRLHDAVLPCHPQPPGQMPSTDARRGWPLCPLLPHLTLGRSWAGTHILDGRKAWRRPLRWNARRTASRRQVCVATPGTPITTVRNQDARTHYPRHQNKQPQTCWAGVRLPSGWGETSGPTAPVLAQESRRVLQPQCRNEALQDSDPKA